MSPFQQILGNILVANITNPTVRIAITFWISLETRSEFTYRDGSRQLSRAHGQLRHLVRNITTFSFNSGQYRDLSAAYARTPYPEPEATV